MLAIGISKITMVIQGVQIIKKTMLAAPGVINDLIGNHYGARLQFCMDATNGINRKQCFYAGQFKGPEICPVIYFMWWQPVLFPVTGQKKHIFPAHAFPAKYDFVFGKRCFNFQKSRCLSGRVLGIQPIKTTTADNADFCLNGHNKSAVIGIFLIAVISYISDRTQLR